MEVYDRCDLCLHEDRRQEAWGATDCPGPLYTRSGKRPRTIQGTCDDTPARPHEDPLTASSGRPSDEGVTGRGSRGLISPSRRMFSAAPAGSHRLVPTRVTEVHISSPPVPHARRPVGTRWRSSRASAPNNKTSPGATSRWDARLCTSDGRRSSPGTLGGRDCVLFPPPIVFRSRQLVSELHDASWTV